MELLKDEKLVYEAPEVEIIEVEVEVGFAGSDPEGTAPDMPWD